MTSNKGIKEEQRGTCLWMWITKSLPKRTDHPEIRKNKIISSTNIASPQKKACMI
jgi:hypothetical protein